MNYFTRDNTAGNTDCELRIINRKLELTMRTIPKDDPNYDKILKEKADQILKIWES